ncbi:interferon-gamma-inducible GTPase 10-like [Ruditapes philippinarum]|uniref:interferon-gamma-inducible GTPase 10-like n=1 Tax=Ruditapes philippinarum TaxID=129788 RepID=UPI00295B6B57|nr:interferon-gamma-inducible GTPase 10-like [Ruditapes philippinarum]
MAEWLNFSPEESSIEEEFNSKLREVYDRDGLKGLNEHVTSKLDRWKHEEITIAVTGNSGVGKSSLINALRGIDQSDENAAKEDVTETTKYHFVVIVSARRFTENDAVIIKALQQLKKPFFLVRSNIGADVYNQRKIQKRKKVLDKIRQDCLSNLHELEVKANDVFLVDSHEHHDFELGKLQISIANNAPEAIKASLIFSYGNMSNEVIEGKIEHFRSRTMSVAIKAMASALPGAGYLMKVDVITDEITFYKEELGLDDASLVKTCAILGVDMTEIKNMISFTDLESFEDEIIKMLQCDKLELRQFCLGFMLVSIKSTLAALAKSYKKVSNTLCKIVDILHHEALEIRKRILEKTRQ